ncbi:MAG: M20/M25/M40 family metallo-hydrolase [Acutalibacteraceae bacterium]|nr:M20/M25/M40 family metallo-hydrolase [Acutalibacteraceae bacterium]
MEKILTSLCNSGTVSGNELVDFEIIKQLMPNIEIETDYNNNIIATMGNPNSEDVILLDAHNDRIGFVVSYIDDNGFIKVANCGGIDRRVLLGSEVTVIGKKLLHGIVCCLPPHLSDGGEDKAPSADSIYIDTGLNKAEVTDIVSLGDNVIVSSKPKKLIGSRFTAGSLDNKAGVATLIKVAHMLVDKNLDCCVKFLFSSQEETGFLGSRTASFAIKPSCAIVVDVSFATQPMVAPEKCGELSKGPMIGFAPILDKEMFSDLKSISHKNDIPYQLEIMSSTTGTNADAITTTASGVRTALISIPLRNMHTQAEIVDMTDIENTAKLIALYITKRGAKNE